MIHFFGGDSDTSSSSSSSSEDFEYQERPKNEGYFENVVPRYSDAMFLEHFRVRRHLAENIAERFRNSAHYHPQTGGYEKLIPLKQILIFLWYAGHQTASFRDVSDRFNIAESTLCLLVERVTLFIRGLADEVIRWPSAEEKVVIESHFRRNGMPGVVGAIDGTHIQIDRPSAADDPDSHLNRKQFYSIQLQVVADHNRRIRNIFVGYPGSVHDGRVFRNSPLFHTLEEKCGELYILGDSAYPCLKHLMTPYRNTGYLSRRQSNFNTVLSKNRCVVEHCFGILKQRFRQLFHIKMRNIANIVSFIQACCVLHNLAVEDNLEFEEFEDENDQHALDEELAFVELDNPDERTGVNKRNMIAEQLLLR